MTLEYIKIDETNSVRADYFQGRLLKIKHDSTKSYRIVLYDLVRGQFYSCDYFDIARGNYPSTVVEIGDYIKDPYYTIQEKALPLESNKSWKEIASERVDDIDNQIDNIEKEIEDLQDRKDFLMQESAVLLYRINNEKEDIKEEMEDVPQFHGCNEFYGHSIADSLTSFKTPIARAVEEKTLYGIKIDFEPWEHRTGCRHCGYNGSFGSGATACPKHGPFGGI